MTKEQIMERISFWENEASCAEEELIDSTEMCQTYYKILDELKENNG